MFVYLAYGCNSCKEVWKEAVSFHQYQRLCKVEKHFSQIILEACIVFIKQYQNPFFFHADFSPSENIGKVRQPCLRRENGKATTIWICPSLFTMLLDYWFWEISQGLLDYEAAYMVKKSNYIFSTDSWVSLSLSPFHSYIFPLNCQGIFSPSLCKCPLKMGKEKNGDRNGIHKWTIWIEVLLLLSIKKK